MSSREPGLHILRSTLVADSDRARAIDVGRPSTPDRTACFLAVPVLFLMALSLIRLANGHDWVDLAFFDQGLWRASQGGGSFSTIFGTDLLEDHFGPGILLFIPLYKLVPTPVWLLLAQGGALWASLWQIVKRLPASVCLRRRVLIGWTIALSPPVAYALLWDAHPVVYAVPFALAGVFAAQDGRPWLALILGLAAAVFRADAGLAVLVALAVLPGIDRKRWLPAAGMFVYLMFAFAMEKHWGNAGDHWPVYYAHLGSSPVEALTHPWRILSTLLSVGAVQKALPWLAATGFLCLARPRLALPALAVALPTLLSGWKGTFYWGFHYGILPALLLAPAWIPALARRPELVRRMVGGAVALSLIGGPFTPQPLIDARAVPAWWFLSPNAELLCLANGIPEEAAVSSYFFHGLTHRHELYRWPRPFRPIPAGESASPYLEQPDAALAAGVDYVIRPRNDLGPVLAGFVPEALTPHFERLRRESTTVANAPSCAGHDDGFS